MSEIPDKENWQCHGWEDHERGQLLSGDAMTFRERLVWLQDADRMAAWLETQRAWIDKDGIVHDPVPLAAVAEEPAAYDSKITPPQDGGSDGADPRG